MYWKCDFLDPDSCCLQQDQEWGFFVYRSRIGFGLFVCWKNVTGCLLDYIYAESNRSRIAYVSLLPTPVRIWTENLENRIGSGLKKTRVPTPLLQSARISSDHAKVISNFASLKSYQHYNVGVSLILHLSVMCPSHFCRVTSPCCSWLHRLEPLRQAQQKDGNSGH